MPAQQKQAASRPPAASPQQAASSPPPAQQGIPEHEIKQNSGVSATMALQAAQKAWDLRQAANAAGDPNAREEILAKAINKEIEAESFGKAAKYTQSGAFQGLAAGAGLGVQPGVTIGKLTGALVGGTISTVTGLLGGGIGSVYGAMNGPMWNLGEMASHGVRGVVGDFPNWKSTPAQKKALEKMVMQTKETQAPSQEELEQMKNDAPDDMPQSWSQSMSDMTSWRPSMPSAPSMPSMPTGAAMGMGGLGAAMGFGGGQSKSPEQQQPAPQAQNPRPKPSVRQSSRQTAQKPQEPQKIKEPPRPKEAPQFEETRPTKPPATKKAPQQAAPKADTPKPKPAPNPKETPAPSASKPQAITKSQSPKAAAPSSESKELNPKPSLPKPKKLLSLRRRSNLQRLPPNPMLPVRAKRTSHPRLQRVQNGRSLKSWRREAQTVSRAARQSPASSPRVKSLLPLRRRHRASLHRGNRRHEV
jgi:hypothetical protein